jgi:hypothetical protein
MSMSSRKAKMFVWEIFGVARFKEALRYFSFGISLDALRSTVNPSSSHPLPPSKLALHDAMGREIVNHPATSRR